MSFPIEIKDVEPELNKQLLSDFTGERRGFLQIGPQKYFLPSKYREQGSDFYNLEVRKDDVWIVTYPRSGTTIMQEMLWLIANNLDYKAASETSLVVRVPFVEFGILVDDGLLGDMLELVKDDPVKTQMAYTIAENRVPMINAMPDPRVIKSHLPFSLLPPSLLKTAKTVYVARNPKDMIVSYFHHNRLLKTQGYIRDFPTYWDYFEKNLLPWSPFWEHIKEAWEKRDEENLLFLFYEDLVNDMPTCVRKVSQFLGKPMSEEDVAKMADHLFIDNFRKNPSTNLDAENLPGMRVGSEPGFIRKGKNGSWKDEMFTPQLIERADKWVAENMAKIPGFSFPTI